MEEDKETLWRKEMTRILNEMALRKSSECNRVHEELFRTHKKIFGEEHIPYWTTFSKGQLDTYLLIRIFSLLNKD